MITIIAITTLCLVAVFLSYLFGRTEGMERGRNEQWIEDYFANVKRLRELRDELGKFKSKKAARK